ncbi:MAG TPA: uroporphyrinogen decarboxylase [Candidatus Acidoferrales bacterium]|nr:uroporphyrinogen decarboxylase [Candidatus Acidoferrales bacterium]
MQNTSLHIPMAVQKVSERRAGQRGCRESLGFVIIGSEKTQHPYMLAPGSQFDRKTLFLRACGGQTTDRAPVWMMRQAGRYLPEYRAVRLKHSFLEVCKTPELAVEVSLQPYRALGMDAVIVFSDILVPAEAMGLPITFGDAGPELPEKIRHRSHVDALRDFDPERDTGFLTEAIAQLCRVVGPEVPVLGFAGAPWTLACYMVDGSGRTGFPDTKRMLHAQPDLLRELLRRIARNTARYLQAQLAAGAAAVQLFDTWAGELSREDYDAFALPAVQQVVNEMHAGKAPVIYYSKASSHLLESAARSGATVLSVDWRVDMAELRATLLERTGRLWPLQGNVDPAVLYGAEPEVRTAVRLALAQTGGQAHVLNLGHGILPDVSVESARAFIQAGQMVTESAGAGGVAVAVVAAPIVPGSV